MRKEIVNRAVDECIKEGILVELLKKCRNEVIAMCIYEYNEEETMEAVKKTEYKLGEEAGFQKGEQALQRFAELTNQLIEQNRYEDLKRATTDTAYREELFLECNL